MRRFLLLAAACIFVLPLAGADEIVVAPGSVRDAVRDRLLSLGAGLGQEMGVEFRRLPAEFRSAGTRVELFPDVAAGSRLRGVMNVPVAIAVDGIVRRTVVVQCLVRTYEDVCVMTRKVERMERVDSSAIAVVRKETTSLAGAVPLRKEDLGAKRARHLLLPGGILLAGDVEPLPVVRRGDPVTLRVRNGAITVTARGVADGEGPVGHVVLVLREGSRERLRARVVDARTVDVLPE